MKNSQKTDLTTEQAILEAAEELFLEKGLALTSTVAIAKKAGCNQALVHYYFRSKDRLFEEVFRKKAAMFLSTFLQISNEDIPFEKKLRRKVEMHFDLLRANPRLPFLLLNELTTNPQRLLSIKQQLADLPATMFKTLKTELDAEIKKGAIRPFSPIDLILLVISLNAIPFLAWPVLSTVVNMPPDVTEQFIERKKKENVEMIIRAIRP